MSFISSSSHHPFIKCCHLKTTFSTYKSSNSPKGFRSPMTISTRAKRVTDPLNEHVKACICGKLHQKSTNQEDHDDCPCLSELIQEFLEEDTATGDDNQVMVGGFTSDEDNKHLSRMELVEVIKDLMNPNHLDSFQVLLHSHVTKAIEIFACFRSNKDVLMKKVMIYLRELGFNSGICKTKWENSSGVTGGNYEFIDVVRLQHRYIIDVDFTSEFEIARPTNQYERLLMALPSVYVGKSDELKQIIRLICEAAKRSIKTRELHLPPWRKNRYMQLKWFGPYKRTTAFVSTNVNQMSSSMPAPVSLMELEKFAVKCRSFGFDAVKNGNHRFVMPVVTRTR